MKNLIWQEIKLNRKEHGCPKIEPGVSIIYMHDKDLFVYLGGYCKNLPIPTKEGEIIRKQKEEEEKEWLSEQNLYYQADYLREKYSDLMDYLFLFDINTNKWERKTLTGKIPTKRKTLITFYEYGHIFLFGGQDKKKVNTDFYVLNMRTFVWKKFFHLESPKCGLHHIMIDMREIKYFLGGVSFPEGISFNEVWAVSLHEVNLGVDMMQLGGIQWTKKKLKGVEVITKNAAGCALNESAGLIFGGFNGSGEPTNNLFKIDFDLMEASIVKTRGETPAPRACHITRDKFILYGGVTSTEEDIRQERYKLSNDLVIYDSIENFWEYPLIGGNYPAPRADLAISTTYSAESEAEPKLIILGGSKIINKQETFGFQELFVLRRATSNWKVVDDTELSSEDASSDAEDERIFSEIPKSKNNKHRTDEEKLRDEFIKMEARVQHRKLEESIAEVNLQQERVNRQRLIKNAEKLKEATLNLDKESRAMLKEKKRIIEEKKKETQMNLDLLEKLAESLALRVIKRKSVQMRNLSLEHAIKVGEGFVLSLDAFISPAIQDDLLEEFISSAKKFNDVITKKEAHKEYLIEFRNQYETLYKVEKQIINGEDKYKYVADKYKVDEKVEVRLKQKGVQAFKSFNLL